MESDFINDNWICELPKTREEQIKYLKDDMNFGNYYYLPITHFDFLIKTFDYENIIEIGTWTGRLLATLAAINPSRSFIGIDIHQGFERLGEIYHLENIKYYCDFFNEGLLGRLSGGKNSAQF